MYDDELDTQVLHAERGLDWRRKAVPARGSGKGGEGANIAGGRERGYRVWKHRKHDLLFSDYKV